MFNFLFVKFLKSARANAGWWVIQAKIGEIYERAKWAFMFGDKMHEDRESVGILNLGWKVLWRVESKMTGNIQNSQCL